MREKNPHFPMVEFLIAFPMADQRFPGSLAGQKAFFPYGW